MKVKSLFISDTHLGVKHNNAKDFFYVLENYEYDNLFLVGDVIDFTALKKKFRWKSVYGKIVSKVLEVAKTKKVVYITGNHDVDLRAFTPFTWQNIEFVDEYIYGDNLIIHGDKFDRLIYNKQWVYGIGDWAYTLVIAVDDLCRFKGTLPKKLKRKVKKLTTYLNQFFKVAEKYTENKKCRNVILGHLHAQEHLTNLSIDNYYNCGNFREDKDFLVENLDGTFELVSL